MLPAAVRWRDLGHSWIMPVIYPTAAHDGAPIKRPYGNRHRVQRSVVKRSTVAIAAAASLALTCWSGPGSPQRPATSAATHSLRSPERPQGLNAYASGAFRAGVAARPRHRPPCAPSTPRRGSQLVYLRTALRSGAGAARPALWAERASSPIRARQIDREAGLDRRHRAPGGARTRPQLAPPGVPGGGAASRP